jgi:hypothetical protein
MSCVEYVCLSCGNMCGPYRPAICPNPKCLHPTDGFIMEWDEQYDFEEPRDHYNEEDYED